MKTRFADRPYSAAAPDAGTDFLLVCVRPIQLTLLKLDSRPICSAGHTPLLVDCKVPPCSGMAVLWSQL